MSEPIISGPITTSLGYNDRELANCKTRMSELRAKLHCAHDTNAQLRAENAKLREACEAALRVFEAWKQDATGFPYLPLKRGESADYDAACDMAERMAATLAECEAKGASV